MEQGWAVRGTTRRADAAGGIEAAGIEAAVADPLMLGTVTDLVADVGVVVWLLGSASGSAEEVAAVNGDRLESLMAHLVDTPVRGFVLEGAGDAPEADLRRGAGIVSAAEERWRIRTRILGEDPADYEGWLTAARGAVNEVIG